ncbi:MAG: ferrochelatase [Pirellulales bacterium]|nr:ferrochelatase [Pirellulales bacterium]
MVSFGGPEGPGDVLPFLDNVLRGRNVPRDRKLEVAKHYELFGGVSPLNAQMRALISAIEAELAIAGPHLPVYWGNRNWQPLLPDTFAQMAADGVRHALALLTSAFSSYSGCRQYLENIAAAQTEVGPSAPQVDKLRGYFNHPGFIEAVADRTRDALLQVPVNRRDGAALVFTAHSIPMNMAAGCDYVEQLNEASRLVAELVGRRDWRIAYQSRSGSPTQPWLEPDINDVLRELAAQGTSDAVIVPIGFTSDHMEVVYDLDTEARATADTLGLDLVRAGTVGVHPRFVRMIRELVVERMTPAAPRPALGILGPRPDRCDPDCCPAR